MSSATKASSKRIRPVSGKTDPFAHGFDYCLALAVAFYMMASTTAYASDEAAKNLAKEPGVIFARELVDVPGKNLVVVKLQIPPKSAQPAASDKSFAHRHPGSVYIYVARGTVRFAIEGQHVQVIHAGESAFEPVGAIHTILENTSTKKPATVIAVLLVPDGDSIVTPVEGSRR